MASSVPPPPPPPPGTPAYGGGAPQQQPPSNNLVWGILTTILCCLPFGIVSIVYATKVDTLWATGQYEAALDNSRKAKNWAVAAAITGVVVAVLYLLVFVGLGVLSTTTTN